MKKLPHINAQYWALIISATTLGETAGDLISQTLHLGYGGASLVLMVLFVLALLAELKSKLQHPALYWLTIIFASLVGTTISDFVTRTLALGYGWGTLLVATVLAVIFYIWRKMTKHVSVQDAFDIKTEFLYWAAILASSTLGTALGDYIADGFGLGFANSALLLMGLLLLITMLAFFTKISREICYWLAIVVTHPMGAVLGDFLTKPESLNLGNVQASLWLLIAFALVIAMSHLRHKINPNP